MEKNGFEEGACPAFLMQDPEIHLKGAPVSEGIAIGFPVFFSGNQEEAVPEFPISTGEVEGEIARYRQALSSSREDLRRLQETLSEEGSVDGVSIIDTHIQMLDDPLMTTHMETKIREMLKNTESVFQSVITDYVDGFSQTPDTFFKQKLLDIKDFSQRVLKNLGPLDDKNKEEFPLNAIVFARELIPSDIASTQASRVSAFITQTGGGTSHAALIVRSKKIPCVVGVDVNILQQAEAEGKRIIVDGLTGDIIVNPSNDTLKKYEDLKNRLTAQYKQLENDRFLPCVMRDGYPIHLYGNINQPADVDLIRHHGGEGVGLFRSEYIFLQDKALFKDEERQFLIYSELIEKAGSLPVVIRVVDVGGDKVPEFFDSVVSEPNPVLGCRGIRFLLRHKDLFRLQLRALLRAAIKGDMRILLPLISDVQELRDAKVFIEKIKLELTSEGIAYSASIPLGCMLEVPSAIFTCDVISAECDFLAIGTNDLAQYTLGIDRTNPLLSDFYHPSHLSVLRMIKLAVVSAKQRNVPISICGEIASNPLIVLMLIGLGLQHFSCSARFMPLLKRTIRQYTLLDAYEIAEKALQLKSDVTAGFSGLGE